MQRHRQKSRATSPTKSRSSRTTSATRSSRSSSSSLSSLHSASQRFTHGTSSGIAYDSTTSRVMMFASPSRTSSHSSTAVATRRSFAQSSMSQSSRDFQSLTRLTPAAAVPRSTIDDVEMSFGQRTPSAKMTMKSSAPQALPSMRSSGPSVAPVMGGMMAPRRQFTTTMAEFDQHGAKQATGISGLQVVPNAREVLESLYNHILELSKSYELRKNQVQFFNKVVYNDAEWKLRVLKQFPDDDLKVERIIGQGQLESLIEEAEQDLVVIDLVNKFKIPDPDPDFIKNTPRPLNASGPHADAILYPFPTAAVEEAATGKASLVPDHPTKPFSLAFAHHIGLKVTPEEVESYAEYMKLTPEEEETKKKNLEQGKDFFQEDLSDMFLSSPNHPQLDEKFWAFFDSSPTLYPHLKPEYHEEYEKTWH